MNLKILAVEDKLRHYQNLVAILKGISSKEQSDWGIDSLEFTHALSATEAFAKLEAAVLDPFDILVLDLKIPDELGGIEDADNGFKVLNFARKVRATKQTVIYTQHLSDPYILTALREGANDFIAKPQPGNVDEQELQTRFVSCWQRVLENDSAGLLEQRIKDLVPFAEAGLAQRFTACFSSFLQKVAHNAEDVEHYATRRFGLDPEKDSQDYLIRCLKNQDDELKAAQKSWVTLNADLMNGYGDALTPIPLDTLLHTIQEKWSPCLRVKNTSLQKKFKGTGQTGVLTFQDDVRVIVQEIMAGALSALPDFGAPHEIKISVQVNDNQAAIKFSDDLVSDDLEQRISESDAKAINDGSIVGPDHGSRRFGRAWGLSVAQHLALRGGGRLIVQPEPTGNVITYFAPLESANVRLAAI